MHRITRWIIVFLCIVGSALLSTYTRIYSSTYRIVRRNSEEAGSSELDDPSEGNVESNTIDDTPELTVDEARLNYLNPYLGDSRYAGKKICRTETTWMHMAQSWSILSGQLEHNCSLIFGNLVIAGLTDEDDLSILESIEEISGYLVIHGVGREYLRLPKLQIIRGQDFVSIRDRRVAMLISSNYNTKSQLDSQQSTGYAVGASHRNVSENQPNCLGSGENSTQKRAVTSFLQILEMPNLISILQHGVYFYDNPGLCYAPLTLKWDDLLEAAEWQTVDIFALPPGGDMDLWHASCFCRHVGQCSTVHPSSSASNDWLTSLTQEVTADIRDEQPFQEEIQATTENPSLFSTLSTTSQPMSRRKRHIFNGHADQLDPILAHTKDSQTQTKRKPRTVAEYPVQNGFRDRLTGPSHSPTHTPSNELSANEIPESSPTDSTSTRPREISTSTSEAPTKEQTTVAVNGNHFETALKPQCKDATVTESFSDRATSPSTVLDYKEVSINANRSTSSHGVELVTSSLLTSPVLGGTIGRETREPVSTSSATSSMTYPVLPCHPTCPKIQGRQYCWGPEASQCQKIHKCQIRLCDGSNWCFRIPKSPTFRNKVNSRRNESTSFTEHCCHSECAASCHGSRARDCKACLRYSNNGECTATCPATTIYDKASYSWKTNPDGMLAFGWKCVKTCPKPFLKDGDICVPKCSRPGTYARDGHCVPCPNNICPKVCSLKEIEKIKGVDYLHKSTLRAMQNCTTFEGDVKLSRQSFIGDPFYNLSAEETVEWSDLVAGLSKLQRITGMLYISAGTDAPWLTNLTFLSKLEIIDGDGHQTQLSRAININSNAHLEFLGFASLRHVGRSNILIMGNPNLCFLDSIQWDQLVPKPRGLNTESIQMETTRPKRSSSKRSIQMETNRPKRSSSKRSLKRQAQVGATLKDMYIYQNGHREYCRGKAAKCAEECSTESGCWGPGPGLCRKCRSWSVFHEDGSRLCVNNCYMVEGYFTHNLNNPSSSAVHSVTASPTDSTTSPDDARVSQTTSTADSTSEDELSPELDSRVCSACSPMCELKLNACYGPGADQCNGPCRWVQDGPYCRKTCPPEKYLDQTDGRCYECSPVCSYPVIPLVTGSLVVHHDDDQVDTNETTSNRMCTGPGNWPGAGGCNYCRQTALRSFGSSNTSYLECVEECPAGTFMHVINLHQRGGSSLRHLNHLNFSNFYRNKSTGNGRQNHPWSRTDAAMLRPLPEQAQLTLKTWILKHTEPLIYGLARICLPCHDQCAVQNHSSSESDLTSTCNGPAPHQCQRCLNASFNGRCVEFCPEDTYAVPRLQRLSEPAGQLTQQSKTSHFLLDLGLEHNAQFKSRFDCYPCHPFCR
ncbi:Epidermal growth factor receptor, partial [Clonorchis sinensis]